MRVASWILVLCTALGAVALFLPSFELRLGGAAVRRRTSLYEVSSDHVLLRRIVAAYHGSAKRKPGDPLVRTVAARRAARPEVALGEVRDAMDRLDAVAQRHRPAGKVVALTVWGLLALEVLLVLLGLAELLRGTYGRPRLMLALVLSGVVTAAAIAAHIVCREAVWKLNHELGHPVIAVGPGVHVLPLAAIAALVAAVVLVAHKRTPMVAHKRTPMVPPKRAPLVPPKRAPLVPPKRAARPARRSLRPGAR